MEKTLEELEEEAEDIQDEITQLKMIDDFKHATQRKIFGKRK